MDTSTPPNKVPFRKRLIPAVTFLGGIYFFLEFFLPKKIGGYEFGKYFEEISDAFIIMGATAIGLGIINLVRVHAGNILKGRRGWFNSVALLLGLIATFLIEFVDFTNAESRANELAKLNSLPKYVKQIQEENLPNKEAATKIKALENTLNKFSEKIETEDFPISANFVENLEIADKELPSELRSSLELAISESSKHQKNLSRNQKVKEDSYKDLSASLQKLFGSAHRVSEKQYQSLDSRKASYFVFEALFTPLGAAMFSLLAFYVATAAYRTFRIQTVETAIMMFAALIVVLGQIPFGPLYISDQLPAMREWLMEYLSTPAFRAILIGSLIAALGMSIRIWLSLEKSPLDGDA